MGLEQPLLDLDWQIIAFLAHLLKAAPRKVHDEGMRLAAAAPRPRVRRELLAPEEATRVLGAAASSQRVASCPCMSSGQPRPAQKETQT